MVNSPKYENTNVVLFYDKDICLPSKLYTVLDTCLQNCGCLQENLKGSL